MNLSVCTISFRHQLISLEQIAEWANEHQFQGVELWGVHAKSLHDFPHYTPQWLASQNLKVSMISDYLPLVGDEAVAISKMQGLCKLANYWGVNKIRTFAGDKASSDITASERNAWTQRLHKLCEVATAYGIYLVVEIHPNTLADTLASTQALLHEVKHSHLKINFDVIHAWEAGDNPEQAFIELAPHIIHMHLKNISEKKLLGIFQPANVYAPAGNRDGMVSIFEGAFDFEAFLHFVMQQTEVNWQELDVSLEWFGPEVLLTLDKDKNSIQKLQSEFNFTLGQLSDQDAMAV